VSAATGARHENHRLCPSAGRNKPFLVSPLHASTFIWIHWGILGPQEHESHCNSTPSPITIRLLTSIATINTRKRPKTPGYHVGLHALRLCCLLLATRFHTASSNLSSQPAAPHMELGLTHYQYNTYFQPEAFARIYRPHYSILVCPTSSLFLPITSHLSPLTSNPQLQCL